MQKPLLLLTRLDLGARLHLTVLLEQSADLSDSTLKCFHACLVNCITRQNCGADGLQVTDS